MTDGRGQEPSAVLLYIICFALRLRQSEPEVPDDCCPGMEKNAPVEVFIAQLKSLKHMMYDRTNGKLLPLTKVKNERVD